MKNGFFAMVSRMKYINRWALMRNEQSENLTEHSFEVAYIAHALAVIGNKKLGKNHNCERAALIGLYHDLPETLTGDMPTPVKYYSDEVRRAYKTVEDEAGKSLVDMLPDEFRADFAPLIVPDGSDTGERKLVKAADKISALIKCNRETLAGNPEFARAAQSTRKAIDELGVPEAAVFIEEFLPSYGMTLDELKES